MYCFVLFIFFIKIYIILCLSPLLYLFIWKVDIKNTVILIPIETHKTKLDFRIFPILNQIWCCFNLNCQKQIYYVFVLRQIPTCISTVERTVVSLKKTWDRKHKSNVSGSRKLIPLWRTYPLSPTYINLLKMTWISY